MGVRRVVILGAALALSAAGLTGLGHPRRPGAAAPSPPRAPSGGNDQAGRASRAGNWSVAVDGWYIELDGVAIGEARGGAEPLETQEPVGPSVLSPYDQTIARHAEQAGLDWRFVAAVIYEESRFEPDSVSDAGAYGLMQVMPIAARDVGELTFREPEANIRTGVRYLQRLEREYSGARDRDRQALMLAAYNAGMAHVQDAQELARFFGYDPLRWDGSMDVMVRLLEEPRIYERLPNGFARGGEVVEYVDRVLRRYAAYRRDLPALPPGCG